MRSLAETRIGHHTPSASADNPGVQAEEEGRAAAAAPSKGALKRARRKAAAAAAAPAAPAENGSATSADPRAVQNAVAVVESSAAARQTPAHSNGSGASLPAAAAAPAAHDGTQAATVDGAAAVQGGMQQLRLQASAAGSTTAQAPRLPGWMACPLTHALLVDPVLCTGDGQTYERTAILRWLAASDASPVTGQPLTSRDILPNHALRSIIQAAQARSSQRSGHRCG